MGGASGFGRNPFRSQSAKSNMPFQPKMAAPQQRQSGDYMGAQQFGSPMQPPQSSGGMRGFQGMNQMQPNIYQEQTPVMSGGYTGGGYGQQQVSQVNPQLEQTRQFLARLNQTTSPMAAMEKNLFS